MALASAIPQHSEEGSTDQEDRLDRVFHALANRTRRAMLRRLARGPAPITELAAPFDMSFPSVSKHLRVLEAAGLVARTVDGRIHRCRFEAAPLAGVEDWLAHYRGFWEETLEALADFAEAPETKGETGDGG